EQIARQSQSTPETAYDELHRLIDDLPPQQLEAAAQARRTIFFARYEASQFGTKAIESEHLLLGLLRKDSRLADRLHRRNTSASEIRKEIEQTKAARAEDFHFHRSPAQQDRKSTRLNSSHLGI